MASTLRLTPSRELHGSLSVTVESSQVLQVRRAIVQSGCHPVGIDNARMPLGPVADQGMRAAACEVGGQGCFTRLILSQ